MCWRAIGRDAQWPHTSPCPAPSRGRCARPLDRRAGKRAARLRGTGRNRRNSRNSQGILGRSWLASRLLKPKKSAHVLVVLVLAVFGTQVEAELVDDLDAIIAEPFLPALGANLGLNPAADLVVNWRRRQRTGA